MNGVVMVKNPFMYGVTNLAPANNAYIEVLALLGNTSSLIAGIAQNVKVS